MKKNLLSLALILSAGIYTSAQNTYINDAVTVKVNPNTLFFHGGSVNVKTSNTADDTPKIINDGNIQINGDFTNENTLGKNFVNTYSAGDNFGQLIINEATSVTGKITIERTKPNLENAYYDLGLPFRNQSVKDVIEAMSNKTFLGNCPIDQSCGARYNQTILVWDPLNTEYDAVTNIDDITAGSDYSIKLNNGGIREFMNTINNQKLSLFGIPNNLSVNKNIKSKIKNYSSFNDFTNVTWGTWKNLTNNYGETYNSYLGNNQTNINGDVLFGKNVHRFTNPFTSNLDLSKIKIGESWVTFNINNITPSLSPTEVYTNALRFMVSKLPNDLTISWNQNFGSTNQIDNTQWRISAYLQKCSGATCNTSTPYFWTGSADALIIKPFEYFEVKYYTINPSNTNGGNGSNIIDASYNFNDKHKTFNQSFSTVAIDNTENTNGIYARNNSMLLNNNELIERGLIGPNDFTQLELYLTKNNTIEDEAAYLVNSGFYSTGNSITNTQLNNKLFLYEESANGTVNRNSQTLMNQFKNDYVGKPLAIGFKNLTNGDQYTIKLRLFEYSILNRVNNFNNGTYYLYDRNTNQVSEINGNSEISFVADDNINNRFELYWNEVPRTLATDDLTTSKATLVYFNNDSQYVRFEDNNTKATVKVFDLTGRLIANHLDINTNEDLKLNISRGSAIYIVNITYENGKTVSKKIIQN